MGSYMNEKQTNGSLSAASAQTQTNGWQFKKVMRKALYKIQIIHYAGSNLSSEIAENTIEIRTLKV